MKEMITTHDVAAMIGIKETTVRNLVKRKELPAYRIGGEFRFDKAEIIEWIDACKLRPIAK